MISSTAIATIASIASVAVNTVYVILTYRMLTYMRRDSRREHRLRHLDDLKSQVIQPLWLWIESSAIPSLEGRQNLIALTNTSIVRDDAPPGDDGVTLKRHLGPGCPPAIQAQGGLFKHAKKIHFNAEMCAFEDFERNRHEFIAEVLAIARECADLIAAMTELPRRGSGDGPNYVDSDLFVAASFKDLAGGITPRVTTHNSIGGFSLQHGNGNVANGREPEIRAWWQKASTLVRSRWHQSEFSNRARQLLVQANVLKEAMKNLELTYDLPHDCEYVGGSSNDAQG